MVIIVKNNEIIAVDKQLLKDLDTNLSDISNIINTISLQISSLKNEKIQIANSEYSVKETECLSLENIKIFDIEKITQTSQTEKETDIQEEIPVQNLNDILKPPLEEPEITPEENIQTDFKADLGISSEDLLLNTKKEDEKTFDFEPKIINEEPDIHEDLVKEPQKTPEIEKQNDIIMPKPELDTKDKSEPAMLSEDKENIPTPEIATVKEETQEQKNETPLQMHVEKEIEISFEDDLQEIREILNNKETFNSTITAELEKASKELGIDMEDLKDLYNELLEQIKDEKKAIYKKLDQKDYQGLHQSYHKLKGAALNLRLSKIALILKKLDELSKEQESIEKIKAITDNFYDIIENKSEKLSTADTADSENKNTKKLPEHLEEVILQTIKNYLLTQNEQQFQKDKKYIEKLLNTKIDSINELEQLIKDI